MNFRETIVSRTEWNEIEGKLVCAIRDFRYATSRFIATFKPLKFEFHR